MYIIIGASRGIGFETVKTLLGQGEKVAALSRNIEPLIELQKKFTELQVQQIDISSEKSIQLWEESWVDWKEIKGVLYCAGQLLNKPFLQIQMEEWIKVYQTNVFGPALFTKAILKNVPDAKVHHVYISSMGGFQGASKYPGLSSYSSSKAAVGCLSDVLAEEFNETQHVFNTLSLGAVQTEMLEEAFPGYLAPVSPEQMAKFISNFLSTGSQYFNGKNLPVALTNP